MEIKRSDKVLCNVYLKDSSYVIEEVMGEHTLTLNFLSRHVLNLQINDYVTFEGSAYKIRHNEKVTKRETSLGWEYNVIFYSERYSLQDVEFFLHGKPERKKNFDSYTGTARQVLELIVKNMNRVESGWKSGSCIESRAETFTFKDKKCGSVLDEVVKAFDTEYWIAGKTISIGKRQYASEGLVLGQGEGMGFTELEVSAVDDAPPVTVLYPYGSDKNLGMDYGSDYLLLPGGVLSLEKNVDKYGRIENSVQFNHIFPKGEFLVTSKIDNLTLQASGMDFNLKDCLLDDVEVIVTFQDGGLAGYDLAIVKESVDDTIKQFKLKENKEENALTVPGDINFSIGDKFILTGLKMPQSYIDKASIQLLEESTKYLDEHCEKRIQLRGKCDDVLFRQMNLFISCGQMVGIVSDELKIEREIRVTKVKRFIENDDLPTYRYELTLSDFLESNGFKDLVDDVDKFPDEIQDKVKPVWEWSKRSWKDVMETLTMMFDPEGDYFTDIIKPLAVHTAQLIVGTNSQQMDLIGVKFIPNADNDPNYFKNTGGKLVHFTVSETGVKEWSISAADHRLNGALPYYVYAKCSKENNTGVILVSERQIKLEEIGGFYHFWVGVLNTPEDSVRSWNPNYGFTEIAGQTITTGVIKDKMARLVIDLVNAKISAMNGATIEGAIKFTSGSSGLDNVAEWPAVKKAIEEAQSTADDAVKEIDETNEALSGFEETVNGAFKDGIIEAAEAKAIEKYINTLNTEKADADAVYNKLYTNIYLTGASKTNLLNSKITYNGTHTNLINSVNTAIADGRTTVAEKADVDTKFTAYKNALADYKSKVEAANKAIQDILKGYSDTALEKGKEALTAAGNAQASANQAKESVTNLNTYVDGAFEDGIISQAEAKAIEKYLNTVKTSKADVEATYNKLYVNTYLTGTAKTGLLNAKVTLFGAIDTLISSINTAIADGKTTAAEKNDVDTKFTAFGTALASFNTAVEIANKAIQDVLKSYSDTAQGKADAAAIAANNAKIAADQAKASVLNLDTYIDGAFSDGIIEEAEAKAIEKYLNTVKTTQQSVQAMYNQLYANANLTGAAKTGLYNAYTSLSSAISNLIAGINWAIADGKTNDSEKLLVDGRFETFNTALASFYTAVEIANKSIQDLIKSSPELKNAMAKNLGYADYAALEAAALAGETVIKGGKINTVLIEAAAIVTSQLMAEAIMAKAINIGPWNITGNSIYAQFSDWNEDPKMVLKNAETYRGGSKYFSMGLSAGLFAKNTRTGLNSADIDSVPGNSSLKYMKYSRVHNMHSDCESVSDKKTTMIIESLGAAKGNTALALIGALQVTGGIASLENFGVDRFLSEGGPKYRRILFNASGTIFLPSTDDIAAYFGKLPEVSHNGTIDGNQPHASLDNAWFTFEIYFHHWATGVLTIRGNSSGNGDTSAITGTPIMKGSTGTYQHGEFSISPGQFAIVALIKRVWCVLYKG